MTQYNYEKVISYMEQCHSMHMHKKSRSVWALTDLKLVSLYIKKLSNGICLTVLTTYLQVSGRAPFMQ
jgi:hypothetical protein